MPKASPRILIFAAGLVWSLSGIFLISITVPWFKEIELFTLFFLLIGGALVGFAKAKLIFNNYSDKNIKRIKAYNKSRICFWAFMPWSSYLIIAVMSGGGSFLRKAGLIPKEVLVPLYVGIGGALFVSSFRYFLYLHRKPKPE